MIPVALMLLAATTHVDLVDQVFHIPAGEWRYVDELSLHQKPAFVSADFEVRSGSGRVRLALIRREDLERLRKDQPYPVLEATRAAGSGQLRSPVLVAGDYVLVVDNRESRDQPADVHLRVGLEFPKVITLSIRRQITVIAISFAVFFAIAGFSARRLLRGIHR